MPDIEYLVGNGFQLSGNGIGEGKIAVQSFEGLDIDIEVTSNVAGNLKKGMCSQSPQPGKRTYGEPTFVCPIVEGEQTLWNWWKKLYPSSKLGKLTREDLNFSFLGNDGKPMVTWLLVGAYPKKYSVSSGNVEETNMATETIQLCIQYLTREN